MTGLDKLFIAAQTRVSMVMDADIKSMLSGGNAANAGLSEFQTKAEDIGGGIFSIGQRVMIYVIAIVALGIFAGMVIKGGNVNDRAEQKQSIPWRVIGIIGFFAVPGILVILQKVGGNLFG